MRKQFFECTEIWKTIALSLRCDDLMIGILCGCIYLRELAEPDVSERHSFFLCCDVVVLVYGPHVIAFVGCMKTNDLR